MAKKIIRKGLIKKKGFFTTFAERAAYIAGTWRAFIFACALIMLWLVTGPIFEYSDSWQMVINIGTTIVIFLMIFLVKNSQNRDIKSLQIKLDELIRVTKGASTSVLDLEELTEEELEEISKTYTQIGRKSRQQTRDNLEELQIPEIPAPDKAKSTNSQKSKAKTPTKPAV